jgi:hypothetical protein
VTGRGLGRRSRRSGDGGLLHSRELADEAVNAEWEGTHGWLPAPPLRPRGPLRARRTRSRALAAPPDEHAAQDARPRPARLPVHRRNTRSDPARVPRRLDLRTRREVCSPVEKSLEVFLRVGESFFGYACCASVVAAGLLLPAMFGAHARSTRAAVIASSASLIVATMALGALCCGAVLVLQAVQVE